MPSMIVIQEMCGRLGMITGKGLADVIEKYCSRKILYFTVLLLVVANVINIGADLGIIAASIQMILGFKFYYWLGLSAIFIILMEIAVPYEKYSKILKWLGLSLGVYVITAFLVKQDWSKIAFYIIIAISTAIGVAINCFQINIIQALFYAAVVNGIASIPLIALIIKLSSDEKIVGRFKTRLISRIIAWITFLFIVLSVIFMIYSLLFK